MKSLPACILASLFCGSVAARADVVINEIMYHPSSENVLEEYIELHNSGTNSVNLTGWEFTKGVSFAFTNVVMAPGSYLVVAANRTAFLAKYPGVANVIGDWTGALRNGGEKIQLDNVQGQTEDEVPYANEGGWGTRRRGFSQGGSRGWVWIAEHGGLGKSLELINPALPNQHGQNWASSLPLNGTPGIANSVQSINAAPLILDVQHLPKIPSSSDTVTITARIRDEAVAGLTVSLSYRNHSTFSPPGFLNSLMFDDGLHGDGLAGDGLYGFTLPAAPHRAVIEFYVSASDSAGNLRTWPAPAAAAPDQGGPPAQSANALYQVDDSVYSGSQPVYRLVMTESERVEFENISRNSDAQMNVTLISVDPLGTEVRYNGGLRVRGAGSRGRTPHNSRLNLPNDRPWYGVSEVNLNSQFSYLQLVGSHLVQKSGMVSADARAVQVRFNGVNPAFATPQGGNVSSWQFGSYVHVEPLGGEWAGAHIPEDGDGNVYRASTSGHNADLSHGTTPNYFMNRGYSKASNSSENDWSDIIHLTDVLNNTPDNAYAAQVRTVVNVEAWMRYFAVMSMMTSLETSIATGRGDDYSMYRGITDPRFLLLPHDLDTILGDGDSGAQPNAGLFRMMNGVVPVLNRFMANPEFAPIYYRELLGMLNTTFSPGEFNPLLDRLLGDWVPQTDIDRIKAHQVMRNNFVRSQIPLAFAFTNTLARVSGYPRTTVALASFAGRANVLNTRSIRVNGQLAAWTITTGNWTIANVPLQPGINRVLAQAFDANTNEIERGFADVWFDDSSVVDVAALAGDTTWTPEAGPYNVTGNLSVPAGVTLTIQPGTTVYFADGAGIEVGGRLVAEGTLTQRIRFTRAPGSSGGWLGITFDESVSDNRIAFADFAFATSGVANFRLLTSLLSLENVTWSDTTKTLIALSNSSLDVRDSVFPTIVAAPLIQGGPIPAGGHVIIERNQFGGTTGLNDIILFRGAQRPGPVLQILDNVFTSASDDVLDIDGTDAHIEGNIFLRVQKNNAVVGDTANAISAGRASGYAPHVVAVRNLFFDVDHVALVKNGASLTLENNTAVGIRVAALNFSEPELDTLPGQRAYVAGNIFQNPPGFAGTNFQNRLPTNGVVQLELSRNIFASGDGVVPSAFPGVPGDLVADARLVNTVSNTITVASIRSDFSLRPGSPAIGTGPNGIDRGALVPEGASISGEPPSPTPYLIAGLTVGGPGISNYVFRVNGGAYQSERPVTDPLTLSFFGNGTYTVQVLGRNSAGVQQDFNAPTTSRSWTVGQGISRARLNEVLARNTSVLAPDGSTPDLVELVNGGPEPVDLWGMGLSDDLNDPYKFTFPGGSSIASRSLLVLFGDSGTGAGLHLGFGLDQNGDALYLTDKPSNGGALLDSVVFGPQLADRSIGRVPDGTWTLNQPTFGLYNIPTPTGDPQLLLLNEWLAASATAFASDFIEIYNADSMPVNLGGLYLTDEPAGAPTLHQIIPLSFVEAGGHVVFLADGEAAAGANHLGFKLAAEQGFLGLLAPDLSIIDCIFYRFQLPDISEGRRPSGGAAFAYFTPPTPGVPNPIVVSTNGGALVLNEVFANNGSLTNADGTLTDWVELFNGSTNEIDLSDASLTDDIATPRRWIFPSGVSLAAGAYLIVRCDPDSPASTNAGLVLNTGFGLAATGDAMYLLNALARGGALLDSVSFGLQAADFSIGRLPNGSGGWQLCIPTRGSQNIVAALAGVSAVRVNEWLADANTGEDDWFELFNPGAQPVAIGGYFLTDDPADRIKSPIPALSFIGTSTNGFVRFIADSEPARGPDHADFKLDKGGDVLALFPPGNGPAVDIVSFGPQQKNVSQGRFPDGSTNYVSFPDTESPGEANYRTLFTVVVSEALTHTDVPLEDAIELQNLTGEEVDISGWFLSDSGNDLKKFRIPDGTVLTPGGFAVFYEYQFNPDPGRGQSFSLSSSKGDDIHLSQTTPGGALTGYRATVKFGAAQNGISFGRYGASTGPDFTALTPRTLGVNNPVDLAQFRTGTGGTNAAPRISPVVIHEIMYHPPDIGTNENVLDEFIELRNTSSAAVTLFDVNHPTNTWRLRDAVDFDFPPNTSLAAGGYLLVVNFNPANAAQLNAFRTKFGVSVSVPIFGPYGGKLDNASDKVELYQPDVPQLPPAEDAGFVPYVLVDKVKYFDGTPWPSLADGSTNGAGYSLQRRSATNYGNDPVNWLAGAPTAGGPTGAAALVLPTITTQPMSTNGAETTTRTFSVTASGAGPFSYQWRFNGHPISGAVGSTLTLANLQQAHAGRYAVLASNPAGAVSSAEAFLSLQSPPIITLEPESRIVLAGAPVSFSVAAVGSSPLRYQWRKGGVNVAGQTNTALSLPNVQPSNEGAYTVVITNVYGAVTSAVAQLTINTPPVITAQPQDRIVNAGGAPSFTVTAQGSAPLRYQWRFDGTDLPGQTNSVLTLNNVQGGAAGGYSVTIINAVGSATSSSATLTVVLPPVVAISASDADASEGGSNPGMFTVTRSYATNSPLTVGFIIEGSAIKGVDYADIAASVTIPADQLSASVIIAPLEDALVEFPETVSLVLTPGAGYTVGLQNTADVTIADGDNQAPVVTVTGPSTGALFPITPTNIVLTATASDPDGSVSRVEFFWQGTNKVGEATSAPYIITWLNTPSGSNALTAVATDNFGKKTTSTPVHLVLNASPDVSLTSPTNGATFAVGANIDLAATATDLDGSVAEVRFYAGSILLNLDASSPYSTIWSNVAAGTYALSAVAVDNRGSVRTSAVVTVSVNTGIAQFTDNFGPRNVVTGSPLTITGSNEGATAEGGEPDPLRLRNDRTVWIAWTAAGSGEVVVDTFTSNFDTVLAVYRGNSLNALTVMGSNDDFENVQSQVTFTAVAGVTYSIQVAGFSSSGNAGNVTLHIKAAFVSAGIAVQPQSQVALPGSDVTFNVTASGSAPLAYQWRRNGVDLPGATASSYTLSNVQGTDEADFTVFVSNAGGSVTSAVAKLTVDDGLVIVRRQHLIPMNGLWRYDQAGIDRGAAWRQFNYDDSAWPLGQALFGVEDTVPSPYALPFTTPLTARGPVTTYYRTKFNYTNSGGIGALVATNFVDDGAVFYVNGREAGRLRMAAGVTNFGAIAQNVLPEGQTNVLTLAATNLVDGENILAVEVHQASAFNPDVVFGLSLTSTLLVTNAPIFVNTHRTVAGVEVTLTGIAGRRYAIDAMGVFGGSWSNLVTLSNFNGQATFMDTNGLPGASRFYRGRLVR